MARLSLSARADEQPSASLTTAQDAVAKSKVGYGLAADLGGRCARDAGPRAAGRAAEASPGEPGRANPIRRRVLASALVLGVGAAFAGGLARFRVETGIESFIPRDGTAAEDMDDKARSFGGDPVVVLLENRDAHRFLADQDQLRRVVGLEGKLSKTPDVAAVYGPGTALNQTAISAQAMLAQISGRRDAIRVEASQKARSAGAAERAARAAGDRAGADFDQRYGSLLVQGIPAGLPTLNNPQFATHVIYDERGAPRSQWRSIVPSPNSVAVLVRPRQGLDQAAAQRLVDTTRREVAGAGLDDTRATVTGVPVLTSSLASEAEAELPLLACLVGLALLLRFVLAPSTATRLRRLWPLAAALSGTAVTLALFGWIGEPMSIGAVAFLPLLLGVGSSFPLYIQGIPGLRRNIVVSLASAAAFATLALSPLPFVRELGLSLAAGVTLTVAASVVAGKRMVAAGAAGSVLTTPTAHGHGGRFAARAVAGCLALVAALGWVALPWVKVEANPESLARGLPALQDAQHVERVLGSSAEVSVRVQGPNVMSPEALAWSRHAEDRLLEKHADQLRPVLSAPDLYRFLGPSPTPQEIAAAQELAPSYITRAVVASDQRSSLMIFGLRFQDLGSQKQLLDDLRSSLPPCPPGMSADVVGLPVAAADGYDEISSDRYAANLAGIAIAAVIIAAGLRTMRSAVRAASVAALATGWSLGLVWLLGVSLSPLTIALGALTTVTGCEYAVLLTNPEGGARVGTRRVVAWACATSTIGYLALAPSRLAILRDFGIMLSVTVVLSFPAALLITRQASNGRGAATEDESMGDAYSPRATAT